MKRLKRNWHAAPFSLWRMSYGDRLGGTSSRNNPLARRFDGVKIADEGNNLIYEAVIERENGKARLTAITILTTLPGQRIDQETIRRVPVQRIAEQASLQLEFQGDSNAPVYLETGAHRSPNDGPTVDEVAADHREGLSRAAIARRRQVSTSTVDKRIREARDLKLLDPPTTGRPRRSDSNGPSRSTLIRKKGNE